MKKNKFITIENNEVDINQDIGSGLFYEGYTFNDFKKDVEALEGDISVNIKSYGGDVHEALAIYDMIRTIPNKVTTRVVGASASAATIISLAGDIRLITSNSRYLIHKPMTMTAGNSDDIEKTLSELKEYDKQLIDMYVARTNLSYDQVLNLMRENKFITSSQAVEMGFIDGVIPEKEKQIKQPVNKIENKMSDKVFKALKVDNEADALVTLSLMQETISGFEAKAKQDEEEKEMKKAEGEDKEKEIEDLKAEIAKLKKKLEEKDEEEKKEAVANILKANANKITPESSEKWQKFGMEQGAEALTELMASIPDPVHNLKDLVNADGGKPNIEQIKADFKAGKINGGEYEQRLKLLNKK